MTIPSHVPKELVVDLDIYALPKGGEDPQLAWMDFCGKGPLVYSPHNGGHWVATTAEDIAAMFRDPKRFSSEEVSIPAHAGQRLVPIESDPPFHADYRANIQRILAPTAVAALENEIRALAVSLIESFRLKGECEFVSEFGLKLPLIVFLKIMGLPEDDRLYLRELTEAFARHPDPDEKGRAYGEIVSYLNDWIARRTAAPGNDAISQLIQAKVGGRVYTREEVSSTSALALFGGLDTVASSLAFWVLHLAEHPEHRDYVRGQKGNLLPVIEELMRRFAIPSMGRIVTEDLVYKGVQMKHGDRLLLSPIIHNLDEVVAVHPEQVDFTRPARQIGFGTGSHICVGAHLARCEFKIFLEEWLARIPDFEVISDRPLIKRAAPTNSVDELWLRWDAPSL